MFVRACPNTCDAKLTFEEFLQFAAVAFTILHPAGLVASALWVKLRGRGRTGPVALPSDEEEQQGEAAPREVDVDTLWG